MNTPYDPPSSEIDGTTPLAPPSKKSRFFAVLGSTMSALIFVAIARYAYAIHSVVTDPALVDSADPKLIAGNISSATVLAVLLGIVSSFGLIVSMATVSVTTYRARWFYVVSLLCASVSLLFFPIGTVLGIVAIVVFYKKRDQFRKPQAGN